MAFPTYRLTVTLPDTRAGRQPNGFYPNVDHLLAEVDLGAQLQKLGITDVGQQIAFIVGVGQALSSVRINDFIVKYGMKGSPPGEPDFTLGISTSVVPS